MKNAQVTVSERVEVEGELTAKGRKPTKAKEIGKVEFIQPTPEDFWIPQDKLQTETKGKGEEAVTYKAPAIGFLADALESYTEVVLRGMLEPKSLQYKAGRAAWTSLEELYKAAATSLKGASGPRIATLWKAKWQGFIVGLGKPANWTAALVSMTDEKIVSGLSASNKAVFEQRLAEFLKTLTEEEKETFEDSATKLATAALSVELDLTL
jgi:hypothetical protein